VVATPELRFDGRVAIVTGAGRGLGREYARALAARGAKVVVNDLGASLSAGGHDHAPATEVAAEIVAAGGEAVANFADVSVEADVASLVDDAIGRFGRIDVVINNAGNMVMDGMPDMEVSQLRRHLDVHVIGAFNVTRAAWSHLQANGYGRVVMTASTAIFGAPFAIAYSTAKGATVSLARSLAAAGDGNGIKVNILIPAAETRMVTSPELRAHSDVAPVDQTADAAARRGPQHVSPMVLVLAHELCPANGEILAAGMGRFGRTFLADTPGIVVPGLSPEQIIDRWDAIVSDAEYTAHASATDSAKHREALVAAVGDESP
jgi:NAD(P)-dependent dehydrogenase (short-subunit alcohol dehydrogenase family)